ncbi:LuxR C-terminal-related transcriptional regulator [Roseicyclus persicicus]|uniref:LuxR C-terminal-related transcriptional regulator n=1 Tax=Roseicyclus persicicus TaxID=2650661 RepID=UPI001447F8C0
MKTALVVQVLMDPAQVDPVTVSGLFAGFTVMTAGVAYVTFTRIRAHLEALRRSRVAAGLDEGASKETVIAQHAVEWGLSQAETEVALFVAKGFSNAEIASMRGCAIATVKSQLGSIYQKSGLETRYQLMAFVTDEVCALAQDTTVAADAAPARVAPAAQPVAPFRRLRQSLPPAA